MHKETTEEYEDRVRQAQIDNQDKLNRNAIGDLNGRKVGHNSYHTKGFYASEHLK